jgi:hypothetical protein
MSFFSPQRCMNTAATRPALMLATNMPSATAWPMLRWNLEIQTVTTVRTIRAAKTPM